MSDANLFGVTFVSDGKGGQVAVGRIFDDKKGRFKDGTDITTSTVVAIAPHQFRTKNSIYNYWLTAHVGVPDKPAVVLTVAEATKQLLAQIEPQPDREGLIETPARVAKAWAHWTRGYNQDVAELVKVFKDGAAGYDQMIVEVDIPFYSHCEHHLAPFFGLATVAYIPQAGKDGRVLGLSKMNRLVDVFARRLQVQERLTVQIADAMEEYLQPLGVGVQLRARHMCVESRGVEHRGCSTTTNALRGVIKEEAAARAEFMLLANTRTPI